MSTNSYEHEPQGAPRFERIARTSRRDAVMLVGLVFTLCGLVLAVGWMSQEVGRGIVLADRCSGRCVAARARADPRLAAGEARGGTDAARP